MNTKRIVFTGLFTAVMCLVSPFSLPIGPVPVSLSVVAVFIAGMILSPIDAFAAEVLYLLLGAVGLPVFSGFKGGSAVLMGATGGYIIAYPFMAFIISIGSKRTKPALVAAMLFSLLFCYTIGTAQLSLVAGMSLRNAVFAGVVPFILFDLAKLICALLICKPLQKACASFYKRS